MGLFGHMRIHESGIDRSPKTPTTSNTPTMPSPTLASSSWLPIVTTTASSVADVDTDTADYSCSHCDHTFTSRIGLVGHLRFNCTETGEPVPGAPTYTHRTRLNCPHCPRTFTHRMGLFGHMRIHEHPRNDLAQRLDNLPIAAAADAAAAQNASVENRWRQLRDTVQSTALAVLGRARHQHQHCFDDNDTGISNLLAEKNRLHKACVDHPTDDNGAGFSRCRRLLQQQPREMQDAWTARKAEEIQGYADRNDWKNFFSWIKAVYGPPTKGTVPLLSADVSTLLTEKTQILQRWPSTSEAASTVPPPSPKPSSPVCRKWGPTWTSTSRHLSRKPSGPCSSSPAGKHPNRPRSLLTSTSTVVPN
ncbi:hypothetical protein SprV_0602245000 [Sparganum proliferum]